VENGFVHLATRSIKLLGRLKGTRCYLTGAMTSAKNPEGWRREISEILKKMGVWIFDPCNKPIQGFPLEGMADWVRRKELLEEERYDEYAKEIKEIRCIDLRMVDVCDFLIGLIDLEIQTCGTWEEIFLANREKKPILLVIVQGKKKAPGWLFGTIPHQFIFNTFEELMEYLRLIDDESIEVDKLKRRWYFFKETNYEI